MKWMIIQWRDKLVLCVVVFMLGSSFLLSQSSYTFQDSFSIKVESKFVNLTSLGKILVVTEDNLLVQYDENGKEINRYSNNQKGKISGVQSGNPFSILIDYADYNSTEVLDKTLSFSEEFSFTEMLNSEKRLLTLSRDNDLWLYDETNAVLKKVSFKGDERFSSINLNLLFKMELHPNWMIEYGNQVFLNEPSMGILVFDNFAQFEKNILIKGLARFEIVNDHLIFKEDGFYKQFNLNNLLTTKIDLPKALHRENLYFTNEVLIIKKNGMLKIFKP